MAPKPLRQGGRGACSEKVEVLAVKRYRCFARDGECKGIWVGHHLLCILFPGMWISGQWAVEREGRKHSSFVKITLL
jgi:hypothetical protein